MDDVLEKYKAFKYAECVELLKKQPEGEMNLVDHLVRDNALNVCQCLLIVAEDDRARINAMQRNLYKSYENVIALGLPGDIVPVEVELATLFNFMWWTVHYLNFSDNLESETRGYLPIIQRGLRRVLGTSCKTNNPDRILYEVLCDASSIGSKFRFKDSDTTSLVMEIVVLLLLFVLKVDCSEPVLKQCLETADIVISDAELHLRVLTAVKEYESASKSHEKLFKFGFVKLNATASESDTRCIDCLRVVLCVCLFLLEKNERIMSVLKGNLNSSMKPLWCYFGGLASFVREDLSQSLGFVVMADGLSMNGELGARFRVLHGCLLSKNGDYQGALRCFGEAETISPLNLAARYYMGEQYGKMGLNDDMVKCFETVVKVKKERRLRKRDPFAGDFQTIVLDVLHPENEISEAEALYAAAVAHGLNENFEESAKFFDRYFESAIRGSEKIIKMPGLVTALHEAAAVNIRTGNLVRARRLLSDASDCYAVEETSEAAVENAPTKDIAWVRNLLARELGTAEEVPEAVALFPEDILRNFDEDVVGLVLASEADDEPKVHLGRAIAALSKYLAAPKNEPRLALVKALSAKVCLAIARIQMPKKPSEAEKTLKRALTCNHGDRDVLREYYNFLSRQGRTGDARKLWKSFRDKETVVGVDQCQSLALRHILRYDETSEREVEKIDMEADASFTGDWR